MIERILRPFYQKLLVNPVATHFKWSDKLVPNHITLISLLTGLFGAFLISVSYPVMGVIFLLVSGYCDTLDGTLARLNHQESAIGTVFDIISDRIVEMSVIIALFCVDPTRGLICLHMLGGVLICVSSFLVVGIFSENTNTQKSFHYSPGILERPEAFIFFIMLIFLPQHFNAIALLFIILLYVTALVRMVQFKIQSSV